MINKKQGISLIVLVITIIVIIILAGAVILSLSANNPIAQATIAKQDSNKAEVQSAVTLYLSRLMAENSGAAIIGAGTLATCTITINGSLIDTGIVDNLGITLPAGVWNISNNGVVTWSLT